VTDGIAELPAGPVKVSAGIVCETPAAGKPAVRIQK
jgi:hypothetical protein